MIEKSPLQLIRQSPSVAIQLSAVNKKKTIVLQFVDEGFPPNLNYIIYLVLQFKYSFQASVLVASTDGIFFKNT